MICRAQGVILRGYGMSESSKIVVLFTREYGKLRLVARGARRPKSKFGASVEPITFGNYIFYKRENRDLQTLTEGDILHSFSGIKVAYARTVYASVVCELLDNMTIEEDRNFPLFRVLLDALRWMEIIQEWAVELPLWYFQLNAAAASGFKPHLSSCIQCDKELSGSEIWFNPLIGGTLCKECGDTGQVMKRDTIRFLEELQMGRPECIDAREIDRIDRKEIDQAMRSFLAYHVQGHRRMKTLEFLDRMVDSKRQMSSEGNRYPKER